MKTQKGWGIYDKDNELLIDTIRTNQELCENDFATRDGISWDELLKEGFSCQEVLLVSAGE